MKNLVKVNKNKIKNIFLNALELNNSADLVHNHVVNLYSNSDSVNVVAVGKSASAMLEGAITALSSRLNHALLITKAKLDSQKIKNNSKVQTILAGHPIPNENSLYAGQMLIQFSEQLNSNDKILFLISGGTSSLVEYFPGSEIISIEELKKLNTWLLGSDKSINEINEIRKKISGIKAGRLLQFIECRSIESIYISDVPDDNIKNIGSGLLVEQELTPDIKNLPNWIHELIDRSDNLSVSTKSYNKIINSKIIFSNLDLRKTIYDVCQTNGLKVSNMKDFLSGNTFSEASKLGHWLKQQKPGAYIWGAETHLSLPAKSGFGGRNQSFALALAKVIQAESNIVVLVAGTDGNDGNTDDAGAIIDGRSIQRGEDRGLDANTCLTAANAGEFLAASGDVLTIGTTGTNVMDIIFALKWD